LINIGLSPYFGDSGAWWCCALFVRVAIELRIMVTAFFWHRRAEPRRFFFMIGD
jgi:hypothetical protein